MATENKVYTFYRKTSIGIAVWKIWFSGNVISYSHAMSEGGAEQVHTEVVELNQSGRDLQAQVHLQMASRLSRMMDKGYKASREEALLGSTNQLGLANPMLAYPIEKVGMPVVTEERPAHVQIKYNGHRSLFTKRDGKVFAYTRKGKAIKTVAHIVRILEPAIPEGVTLDGELYVHGKPLQAISSLIKREQPGSRSLSLHIYDIVEPQVFSERWRYCRSLIDPVANEQVFCVPTERVTSIQSAYDHFRRSRDLQHEGSMLRIDQAGYEDGKRSSQLLKLKERLDEDFVVVDVFPGKNEVGIFKLRLNDRPGTFDCLAHGSVPEKQEILRNKERYIGKKVEVLYAEKTSDGVPFHGVANGFKEEL